MIVGGAKQSLPELAQPIVRDLGAIDNRVLLRRVVPAAEAQRTRVTVVGRATRLSTLSGDDTIMLSEWGLWMPPAGLAFPGMAPGNLSPIGYHAA